jgi:membrane protease YdiL (CAAX protease family)
VWLTDLTGTDLTGELSPPAAPNNGAAAKPFPNVLPSIGWIVLYFILQGLCTAILLLSGVGGADPSNITSATDNPIVILWGLVLAAVVQLLLMGLYLRKAGRVRRLGLDSFGRMPPLHALGLAVLLVVAAMIFNFVYATYVIPGVGMQEDMAKMLAAIPRTPVNIAAGLFAIAIAAPLVEELLFRGLLQNALTRHMPIWGAIILSSLIFAAVHLQPYAIPGLMSLSIAFGYLYHRTGSLRMNILLHMANNGFALLLTQGMN